MALAAVAFSLGLPAAASAQITSVFAGQTMSGLAIPCTAQSDGVRVCHGTDGGGSGPDLRLKAFDGAPLEVYVILPPAPASGSDGPFPLLAQNHGYGQAAEGPGSAGGTSEYLGPTADTFAREGVAVLQLTARGFGDSCGKADHLLTDQALCQSSGFIRLDDDRYEARDVQDAIGKLVDEGVVNAAHLGTTGESYGGGISMQLATLRDRVMYPDGSLHPWTSPHGTPLSFTAAAPVIPWSDLVYSLVPNGHTLDYTVAGPHDDLEPVGVEKQSFVSGLYALGQASGTYAPPGAFPQWDLTSWYADINAGEPYEGNPQVDYVVDQIARYHSAYYLLDGAYGAPPEPPPPLLIANGFTDDLFPVDEALRYANLEQSLFPGDPVSLFDWDGGHQRGQNKKADNALLASQIKAFMDYYLLGAGSQPASGFTALTQTCPSTAPSGGPFFASTWAGLHPGEVDYSSAGAQTVLSGGGDPSVAKAFDPIAGGGACATAPAGTEPGVATYALPAVTGSGYTLLGSPTVIATLSVTGEYPELAMRLLDVDPAAGTETLVARGLYRPDPASPDGRQVFQLHPGAWHFAAGHVPELELLGRDVPYGRASNGQFQITVSGLQLRLPVHEAPGAAAVPRTVVKPLPHVYPTHTTPTCHPRAPTSRIDKRATRASRRGLAVRGTAGETPCRGATAGERRRERVRVVYVTVYRPVGHGRCRFLLPSGRLGRPRSCRVPVELRASGTSHWRLRLARRIPPGHYLVRSDAIDGFGHHQHHSNASVQAIFVRR